MKHWSNESPVPKPPQVYTVDFYDDQTVVCRKMSQVHPPCKKPIFSVHFPVTSPQNKANELRDFIRDGIYSNMKYEFLYTEPQKNKHHILIRKRIW